MTATRLYTGSDAVRAADKLRALRDNQDAWPYPHVYPPPSSIPVHAVTLTPVAVPAVGAQVEVLRYRVPSGFAFWMQAIVQQYKGGSITFGDGVWTVDRNAPVGVGSVQASPVQGLAGLPVPLGSFEVCPWPLPRAYEFQPLDVVRSKLTNVSLAPGLLVSGFFGWLVPWTETS